MTWKGSGQETVGAEPTLWAISDLHTGHLGNKPVAESLYPSSPDDWLIVAGDVAERTDEIRWSLDLLRRRFAKVIWVPGNHAGASPTPGCGRCCRIPNTRPATSTTSAVTS